MSLELSGLKEELRSAFAALRSPRDLAAFLDVDYSRLVYHVYKISAAEKYNSFNIRKRSGGLRLISAPKTSLKIIQRKLNQVLQAVYRPNACVHGFTENRSIVTNARPHTRCRYVLNIDLAHFFPSINFGRVRGMFMRPPYNIPANVSTVLAQVCCHNNELPQGAPTSPIIANMICARLDNELRRLALTCRCSYTRYADDISFSTTLSRFPRDLAAVDTENGMTEVVLGRRLREIIHSNGFKVNQDKVRLLDSHHRQEVTGLVVNIHANVRRSLVRQIRAMLHAWRKHGLASAQAEHLERYDRRHRKSNRSAISFKRVVKGKIDFVGMVRGNQDGVYRHLLICYAELDPDFAITDETGWDKVKRQMEEARGRLAKASSVEHYQSVGHICRETLISLAQTVYEADRHPQTDEVAPSTTDMKRMIDAYLAVELKGSQNKEIRRVAKGTFDLANNLQHKRTATRVDAQACFSATESLVDVITAIDAER